MTHKSTQAKIKYTKQNTTHKRHTTGPLSIILLNTDHESYSIIFFQIILLLNTDRKSYDSRAP